METTAAAAEVFSTLTSIGLLGAVIALCFLGFAVWVSREAFRTGRSLRLKVSPRSLEIDLGSDNRGPQGTQPKEGEMKRVAAEDNIHELNADRDRVETREVGSDDAISVRNGTGG